LTSTAICRFAEPISLTSIFPYLPEMIESFHVPPNDIARWAGIASAIYSLSQCLTAITWGRLSDRFGRKPIILICLVNTMITSLLWGFSTSLPMALVARALSGAGNGNVGIIRTMVAEMCPWRELQPRAFSIMPLVYNVGSVLGPAIGGSLANPYRVDPEKSVRGRFFERFPYAPPNIFAACFFAVGIVTGYLYLHETLESRRYQRDYGRELGQKLKALCKRIGHRSTNAGRTEAQQNSESDPLLKNSSTTSPFPASDEENGAISHAKTLEPATWREVLTPQALVNLLVYTLLAMHSIAYDQLLSVFMHHPYQPPSHPSDNPTVSLPIHFSSGLGLPSPRIGLLFTLYGISNLLFQFLLFPPLARHFGVLHCMRVCSLIFPIVYIISPFAALLPTTQGREGVLLTLWLMKGLAGSFGFPCSTILLTNAAESLRALGTLNGVATSVSAVGRAAGPVVAGNVFTLGVKHGYVVAPFWLLGMLAAVGAVPCWWLTEGEGFGDDDSEPTYAADEEDVKGDEDEEGDEQQATRPASADVAVEEEEDNEGLGALLSRTTTYSSYRGSEAMVTDDEDEDADVAAGSWAPSSGLPSTGLSTRQASRSRRPSEAAASGSQSQNRRQRIPRIRRKSSVPIGLGTGFRRLSSNLGASGSGLGTGGGLGG